MKYSPPVDQGLELLYEDKHLLVLNKPAGLLSVPGRGADKLDSLITRVQKEYDDALIVHRLDMATSGILVLARGSKSHRALSMQFQHRLVKKEYVAVVHGELTATGGMIDLPLLTDWPNRPKQMVDFVHGKASQTRYRLLQKDSVRKRTRLSLMPTTGRTHQLRVHCQYIGHAIVGDRLYAPTQLAQQEERLLLHAQSLCFTHPETEEEMAFDREAEF
ncbi:MAG: RluA family pseudouridine synthase [Gammaproteobacteria bacterium]|nr:RluA family pseudouridine synthase [Gammaproteobacteria bacterium]